jgi:hypothetical protein
MNRSCAGILFAACTHADLASVPIDGTPEEQAVALEVLELWAGLDWVVPPAVRSVRFVDLDAPLLQREDVFGGYYRDGRITLGRRAKTPFGDHWVQSTLKHELGHGVDYRVTPRLSSRWLEEPIGTPRDMRERFANTARYIPGPLDFVIEFGAECWGEAFHKEKRDFRTMVVEPWLSWVDPPATQTVWDLAEEEIGFVGVNTVFPSAGAEGPPGQGASFELLLSLPGFGFDRYSFAPPRDGQAPCIERREDTLPIQPEPVYTVPFGELSLALPRDDGAMLSKLRISELPSSAVLEVGFLWHPDEPHLVSVLDARCWDLARASDGDREWIVDGPHVWLAKAEGGRFQLVHFGPPVEVPSWRLAEGWRDELGDANVARTCLVPG